MTGSLQPDANGHWWAATGPEDDDPWCSGCHQPMTHGPARLAPCPNPKENPMPSVHDRPHARLYAADLEVLTPVEFTDELNEELAAVVSSAVELGLNALRVSIRDAIYSQPDLREHADAVVVRLDY